MTTTPPDAVSAVPRRESGAVIAARGRELVERTYRALAAGDIGGMDDLVVGLGATRGALAADDWRRFVTEVVRPHPIVPVIHEEPFTHRAFAKPRGYAGDAPLLDLIYREPAGYDGPLSPIGTRLYEWAGAQPACRSVVERREILAALIDRVAAERPNPRILSVACGHLREAQRSDAVSAGAIEEFVALDQDAESIALVSREQRHRRVTPVRASIRRLLVAPAAYGTFDLAYAAGLYDYLDAPLARRLTASLFAALRPGGRLLVANFAPELRDIGYMEAIMDWTLIYRDERAVAAFAADIPPADVAERSTFRDEAGNVVYLLLRKG